MPNATGREKKPLGFLIAWLREGILWDTHDKHMESRILIKRDDRVEARQWAHAQPHLADLLEQENKWSDGKARLDAAGNIEEPLLIH